MKDKSYFIINQNIKNIALNNPNVINIKNGSTLEMTNSFYRYRLYNNIKNIYNDKPWNLNADIIKCNIE